MRLYLKAMVKNKALEKWGSAKAIREQRVERAKVKYGGVRHVAAFSLAP